jgi:serine protease Do
MAMKKALLTVLVAALAGTSGFAQNKSSPKEAHLGIGIESVPPALYSQMPGILAKGQGVLVGHVGKDSPAAKAGLHANDILLSYGDQKLYSPEQLVKLVRGDKPGHEVALRFLHGGKTMDAKVTLGESEHANAPENSHVFRLLPDERLREVFEEFESKTDGSVWNSFDEIRLSRIDSKHWKADVQYRAVDGRKVSKSYSGTRDEIRQAIRAEKDVPANEQTQLLRALNLHEPVFEFHFPSSGLMPPGYSDRP